MLTIDDPAERTVPTTRWDPARTPPREIRATASGRSTAAPHRPDNEDAWGLDPAGAFVVADGIGGRPGGRVAADAAVAALLRSLIDDVVDWATVLADANDAVRAATAAARRPEGGCVVAALRCRHGRVAVLSAGDVRAYRLRASGVQLLTRDHSVAGAIADLGLHRADSGLSRRELDAVTSYLGDPLAWTEFSVHELTVRPGDRIVLCSDGVHRFVTIQDFADAGLLSTPDAAVDHLLDRCSRAGTTDDATAVVVDLEPDAGDDR